MLTEFGQVLIFLILGGIFVAGGIAMNIMLRPTKPTRAKLTSYECGEEPVGSAWITFNVRFFVVALVYLLFSVEIVFLFPWAVVYQKIGMVAFWEMGVFVAILLVGFAYVWAKGDLEWVRPAPRVPRLNDLITTDAPRLRPQPPAALPAEPVETVPL